MRIRRIGVTAGLAAIAGLILTGLTAPSAPALPTIAGDLKCEVTDAPMLYGRPLSYAFLNPQPPPLRSATVRYSAPVTGCRGTTPATPAPGGIHHGVVELKGRLKVADCAKVPGQLKLKLNLMDASGTRRVARSSLKPGGVLYHDFPVDPIWVATFTGTLKSTAKSFGGEVISLRITWDGNDFHNRCLTSTVTSFTVLDGELTIGNPT